jgi:hypothetical protein
MTEDSSLPFPYVREENRIWPKNSSINPLFQNLMHFELQLGREAAGNNAPGFPNPTGCHPADADPAEAYASVLAARWHDAPSNGQDRPPPAIERESRHR